MPVVAGRMSSGPFYWEWHFITKGQGGSDEYNRDGRIGCASFLDVLRAIAIGKVECFAWWL